MDSAVLKFFKYEQNNRQTNHVYEYLEIHNTLGIQKKKIVLRIHKF